MSAPSGLKTSAVALAEDGDRVPEQMALGSSIGGDLGASMKLNDADAALQARLDNLRRD